MTNIYSQCTQCKTIYPNAPATCPACGGVTFVGIEKKKRGKKQEVEEK